MVEGFERAPENWQTDPMMVDHVAIEVADFDARLKVFEALGMRVQRIGRYGMDQSRRIAMVGDGTGFKFEVIEADADAFSHLAYRTDDVAGTFAELCAVPGDGGDTLFQPLMEPKRLPEAAKGDTASVSEPGGIRIQLVKYDEDSPDL